MRFLLNKKQLTTPKVYSAFEKFVLERILKLFRPSFDSWSDISKTIDSGGTFGDGLTFIETSNRFKGERYRIAQDLRGPEYGSYYYATIDWLDTLTDEERARFEPYFNDSDCGLLLVDGDRFNAIDTGLKGLWENIFKEWFESNTGHKICNIVIR